MPIINTEYEMEYARHYYSGAALRTGQEFSYDQWVFTPRQFTNWMLSLPRGTFRVVDFLPIELEERQRLGIETDASSRSRLSPLDPPDLRAAMRRMGKGVHRATVTPMPFPKEDGYASS